MLTLTVLATGLFVAAAVSDLGWRRIPNGLVVALFALGLLRLGLDWGAGASIATLAADLAASLVLLGLGAVAFQARLLGGGDVKLLAAATLWIGLADLLPFLVRTALAGGVLAIGMLLWGLVRRGRGAHGSLPYGVAIALGGILTAFAHP